MTKMYLTLGKKTPIPPVPMGAPIQEEYVLSKLPIKSFDSNEYFKLRGSELFNYKVIEFPIIHEDMGVIDACYLKSGLLFFSFDVEPRHLMEGDILTFSVGGLRMWVE